MFSRNKFQLILKCYHLIDNKKYFPPGHIKCDPSAKYNPIFEHANRVFTLYYMSHTKLLIDESLIGFHFIISNENITVNKNKHDKEKRIRRPCIINSYDNIMSVVNETDKMLYTYLDERRILKYWKKLTFNILTRIVLNSYLIHKEVVKIKTMLRIEFMSDIIFEMECKWLRKKKYQLYNNETKTFGLMKLRGRNMKQCVVCSDKINGIKRSNLIRAQCQKGVHPVCFGKHACYKSIYI